MRKGTVVRVKRCRGEDPVRTIILGPVRTANTDIPPHAELPNEDLTLCGFIGKAFGMCVSGREDKPRSPVPHDRRHGLRVPQVMRLVETNSNIFGWNDTILLQRLVAAGLDTKNPPPRAKRPPGEYTALMLDVIRRWQKFIEAEEDHYQKLIALPPFKGLGQPQMAITVPTNFLRRNLCSQYTRLKDGTTGLVGLMDLMKPKKGHGESNTELSEVDAQRLENVSTKNFVDLDCDDEYDYYAVDLAASQKLFNGMDFRDLLGHGEDENAHLLGQLVERRDEVALMEIDGAALMYGGRKRWDDKDLLRLHYYVDDLGESDPESEDDDPVHEPLNSPLPDDALYFDAETLGGRRYRAATAARTAEARKRGMSLAEFDHCAGQRRLSQPQTPDDEEKMLALMVNRQINSFRKSVYGRNYTNYDDQSPAILEIDRQLAGYANLSYESLKPLDPFLSATPADRRQYLGPVWEDGPKQRYRHRRLRNVDAGHQGEEFGF